LPRSTSFNFIVNRYQQLSLVNEIAKIVDTPAKIIVLEPKNTTPIDQSAILFFNDTPQFVEFYRKTMISFEYSKELHFVVYIENFRLGQFNNLSYDLLNPNSILRHSYFVTRFDNNFIDLTTFTIFQQPNCRQARHKRINRYSITLRKWKNRKFSIVKFRNFNKCNLTVFDNFLVAKVLQIFETSLTYTKEVSNGSSFYDIRFFTMSIRAFNTNRQNRRWDVQTHHISISDNVILASRPAVYSFLQKAFLPFDLQVWFWLIGFLLFGMIVIIVVSCLSREAQHFVFGLQVKAPLLNLM
jgi:hypothetical protein